MSRIGKKIVVLPQGVKASFEGNTLTVEGPLGKLISKIHDSLAVDIQGSNVTIKMLKDGEEKTTQSLQGLTRALTANMVLGTTKGFQKSLMIEGTGYRAAVQDGKLNLQLGFTHPIALDIPKELNIGVEKQVQITIKGADKQLVGSWAAKIRAFKPPEPYKGKGVRYSNEFIKKKVGKAAIKQAG